MQQYRVKIGLMCTNYNFNNRVKTYLGKIIMDFGKYSIKMENNVN